MIRRIMALLGYVPPEQNKDLRVALVKKNVEKELPKPVININIKDPAPEDEDQRENYVSQVSGFHVDILRPKLQQLVSEIRGQFELINRETFGYSQDEYDLFLKGTINGLWLIHDWGELMVNEQLANQTPDESQLTDDDKAELKAKLN